MAVNFFKMVLSAVGQQTNCTPSVQPSIFQYIESTIRKLLVDIRNRANVRPTRQVPADGSSTTTPITIAKRLNFQERLAISREKKLQNQFEKIQKLLETSRKQLPEIKP